MARNKKVEILSNEQEVLHPMTDGDCVIFEDGQTLTQKLSEDDSVKYTPEIVNSSPMFKVGEGNTVDYSDNVLDGAYERATLQGQTYVNYIQESSADEITLPTPFTEYERTQHNTLTSDEEGTLGINLVGQSYVNALQHDSEEEYVVLGESLEFQEKKVEYTNEGQIKSAMLKGQTLVNIVDRIELKDATTYCYLHLRHYKPQATYTYFIFNAPTNMTKIYLGQSDGTQLWCGWTSDFKRVGSTIIKTVVCPESQTLQYTLPHFEYSGDKPNNIDNLRIMLIEGDHTLEDIPYFEGMQSVTVSMKLENLCHRHTTSELAKNGKTFNANSLSDRCIKLVDYKEGAAATYGMKPNTKYLVQFKISNLVLDGLSSLTMVFSVGEPDSTNCLFKNAIKTGLITANGVYRVVLTTTDVVSTSGVEIKGIAAEWESTGSALRSLTISNVMYVEYQNGIENWDLPYFEDYQVMKPVQVESVNKNLQPLGTYATNTGSNVSTLDDVNGYIRVVPGKKYRVSCGTEIKGSTMRWFDRNKKQLEDTNGQVREAPANAYYMRLLINTDLDYLNTVQVEESTDGTASAYIDNESKTTYSWDEVILRKIGDVEDTLDLTTGEWIQRIGEIVLDGSEYFDTSKDYFWHINQNLSNDNYTTFMLEGRDGKPSSSNFICDKLPNKPTWLTVETGVWADSAIVLTLPTSTATTTLQLQEYLQSNPIRVQYELNKPIVHKVNLSRPNLQVYDDITHVHTRCLDGTLIPNIYLPSDISYPAILEPGKKYNVSINHTQVSADNPLKVNVGGTEITMTDSRMTLTTPTTLANSNVSFTGKGNKIKESMLIKNSSLLTRDLPHFNGIGSVQLGKTIENLCSASGFKAGNSEATITWHDNYAHTKISNKAGSCVFVYELIKPLENGKKYFVYSPQTLGNDSCRVSFRRVYNNSLSYARQQTVLPKNGKCVIEIDQTDNPYTHICVGCHHDIPLNTEFDVYRPIICEYEPGMENWDWESIGYFTGTKNIGNEFIKVSNSDATKYNGLYITKDQPIELTWEQGRINPSGVGDSYTNAINNAVSYGIRTKGLLNLKPNTTYRISLGDKVSFKYHIAVFDNWDNALPSVTSLGISGDWISSVDTIFTTTKDAHKIGINVQKQNASSITPPESVHVQVRLEEVTDVVLRSCSGKYDELDLTRGTYTQNVGMVYVDGVNQHSNYITVVGDSYQPTDTTLKTFDIRCDGAVVDSICLSNRFPMRESMTSTDINFESVRIHSTNTSCRLTIKKEKASTVDEFKLWLQDNPLEIVYALTTPIVHKVHIGNKNEANIEVTKPNGVFTLPTLYTEQTHIDLTNNGIIPKVQSRDYIAYPVLPMLSRTYTLQHNLTGGISNLTVDLLGRTQEITYQNHKSLVYAPETMDAKLHDELRISGKGKIGKVMYIDGGYMDREIPYIEGMKNAVNPIVKNYTNTQENICYVDCGEIRLTPDMFEQGSIYSVQAHVGLHYNDDKTNATTRLRTKNLIKVEPNETYVFMAQNNDYVYSMHFYDKNGIKVGVASPYDLSWKGTTPFTIPSNCETGAIFIAKAFHTTITLDNIDAFDCGLIKVSEIKQLRSLPHGVHDEIDLETGKYIQRVGEITFNGTESWIVGYAAWDNKRTYYNNHFVDIKTMKGDNGSGQAYYDAVRCPQLHRSYMSRLASALIDGVCSYYYSGYQRIFISKQDCATVEELKLWLQENPITVQYELPEPIVKDIVIHNYPHSYEGGHVIIENGDPNTPIPAQLTYRAVTNRSGQIQQHTEQVEKQEREINELETLILANIHLSQTR